MHDVGGAETDRPLTIAAGWRTIVGAGMGSAVGLTGLGFYSFGLFVKPLSAAFGWSRGQVAFGLSCITLGTIITVPVIGMVTDRLGVRRVVLPSLLGLALGYALLSQVQPSIWTFYAACLGLALLGGGTTPVTWSRVVSVTFDRNRGMALGLAMLGTALAGLIGVPLLQGIIGSRGWRASYLAIAAFVVLVAWPTVFLLLREPRSSRPAGVGTGSGLSLGEAIRTPAFWTIGAGILVLIAAQSGVTVHLVSLMTDRGMTPVRAAGIAGAMAVSILTGRAGVGVLLDRFHPPWVAGLLLTLPMAGAVLLAVCGSNASGLLLAVLLLGLGAGGEIDFLAYFAGRHFGLRSYGAIYGCLFLMFSLGNGIGAPLVGTIYDRTHSYLPALWGAAAGFGLGALLFASLTRYPLFQALEPGAAR